MEIHEQYRRRRERLAYGYNKSMYTDPLFSRLEDLRKKVNSTTIVTTR